MGGGFGGAGAGGSRLSGSLGDLRTVGCCGGGVLGRGTGLDSLVEPGLLLLVRCVARFTQRRLDDDLTDGRLDESVTDIIAQLGTAGVAAVGGVSGSNSPKGKVVLPGQGNGIGCGIAGALVEKLDGTVIAVAGLPGGQIQGDAAGVVLPFRPSLI